MDSSIRNQPTADGTSIVREILASEKILETAAERVLSTNEAVRVDVFPAHLQETSFDIWPHSSTKEIADPISNTIVSSGGTMTSSADGQISSFVDIDLKQVDIDELLTKHHKSKELFEERSLASERPSAPTSSKSFEVLAWVANHEQSSNEHQLKRLDSLDIEMDGHRTGRIVNKSNSQESSFHSSVISAASEISHVDNAVQCDGENEVRCAQGQEFEMANGCNPSCYENLGKQSASTTCLIQPLLKNVLDAMETKLEAFRWTVKAELGRPDTPDSPPKWFLEYMEACRFNDDKEEVASTVIGELHHIRQQISSQTRKMDEFLERAESDKRQRLKAACGEQQTTEIRLQNALAELEITRAEMVKVQRESVRKLALENAKHTEEISTFEKENAATAHALEQIQTEARLLKSSLESSLSKNESTLVQLGKTKGHLEEALDRENSLKLELKELQNQLSSMVKEIDEYRLGRQQIIGLAKIAAFARDTMLAESKQADMKKKCLEYWKIEEDVRRRPHKDSPRNTANKLIKMARVEEKMLTSQDKFLDKSNLATTVRSLLDWKGFIVGGCIEKNERTFYLSLGRSEVYRYENGSWVRPFSSEGSCSVELPSETLLYGEIIFEYRGSGKGQKKCQSLYIYDAFYLGGEYIGDKHLVDRYSLCQKFAKAVNKPSRNDLIAVRVHKMYDTEHMSLLFKKLNRQYMKGGGPTEKLVYMVDETSCILPRGVLFLKGTKDPWMLGFSKSTQKQYFFHTMKRVSEYNAPKDSCLPFSLCMEKRFLWEWPEESRLLSRQPEEASDEKLSIRDVKTFVHSMSAQSGIACS